MCQGKSRVIFIGITCGLSAPYVAGQLQHCMENLDIFTPVLMGFNPVEQARLINYNRLRFFHCIFLKDKLNINLLFRRLFQKSTNWGMEQKLSWWYDVDWLYKPIWLLAVPVNYSLLIQEYTSLECLVCGDILVLAKRCQKRTWFVLSQNILNEPDLLSLFPVTVANQMQSLTTSCKAFILNPVIGVCIIHHHLLPSC